LNSGEDREALIRDIAALMRGLAVPISLELPLGSALSPWIDIHSRLIGFGWATTEQYEEALRKVLDGGAYQGNEQA
jgi:hypothetical protein